jgi:hypothetical protein
MLSLLLRLFSLFVLALFWLNGGYSVRRKLIVTTIYLAVFAVSFLAPTFGSWGVIIFGLALYFAVFPSRGRGHS